MDPRPIRLTQIDAEDFGGLVDPQPYVVVGPMPGGGGGATGGIQTVRPGENVLIDDSDPENIVIAAMGSSAYNEWTKQGNTGSEEDFLNSLRGEKGERGDKGDRGDQGIQGIPGPEGTAGENGPKGDAGQSITIEDYLDSEDELPALEATLTPADAGKSYITIDTGHLYFWNGTGFNDAGMVVGAKGADGINGQPGVQGIQGEQGIPGTKGDKGDVGDTGPRGLQGVQGLPGVRGLVGEQGLPGEQGERGLTGSTGLQGLSGIQGVQGIQGIPGPIIPEGQVGGMQVATGTASSTVTQIILEFGNYRLRIRGGSANVAILELGTSSPTPIPTDFSSIGFTSSTPAVLGRSGNATSVTNAAWTIISGGAEHATFVIKNRSTGTVWEGICLAPFAGASTAFNYTVKVTRIA